MLRMFSLKGEEVPIDQADHAIWFDLIAPSREEELSVEQIVGRDVPTPDEREALEDSSRNFEHEGAVFFSPTLLGRREEGAFISGPVTFMLHGDKLITIRMINPRAFEIGQGRASARVSNAKSGIDIAAALLEGAIERIADLLAEQSQQADSLSAELLLEDARRDLKADLTSIGRMGAIAALCHLSLSSLQRSIIFLASTNPNAPLNPERIGVFRNDIEELERQSEAVQDRIAFLQESTLGLINVKQTNVLKALSLATIAFIPATLVASIFGMNFEFMHWYERSWGPPIAFSMMVIAPILLFAIARWRKWF